MKDLSRSAVIASGLVSLSAALICLYAFSPMGLAAAGDRAMMLAPLIAGFSGSLALALMGRILTGAASPPGALLRDALVIMLLVIAVDPGMQVWQPPAAWHEFFMLSHAGGGTAVCIYFAVVIWGLARRGQHPPAGSGVFYLLVPILFNMLLGLGSAPLLAQLGGALNSGLGQDIQIALGRTCMLFVFNLVLFAGVGLVMDRRWTRDWRVHGLLLFSAAHAAFSPLFANMVSGADIAGLPLPLQIIGVAAGTGLAQAGLWAETFLVTGMLIDALHRRRPTFYAAHIHWRGGLGKGAMYGVLFMLLLQAFGHATHLPGLVNLVTAWPAMATAFGGAILFCLARTIIESFDESPPFLNRLLENLRQPMNHLRGILLGLGLAGIILLDIQHAAVGYRFVCGLLLGALIYAGGDLLRDSYAVLGKHYQYLQTGRVYLLHAALGGIIGGGIAWYFDAAQIAIITQRLNAYATLYFAGAGKSQTDYIIYPLFSRWGELDLGIVQGGARLLYNDSLSGVINWSIAAPLFSFNLVVLTALFERSLNPLRRLFSVNGLTGVMEQTVRVLRWGLWMAPIIQTFLRMAPDPSWYNQDGAVRTVVASLASLSMTRDAFRQWSLDVFLGLLAYEWLRVIIWFDHMGLRVASLVNLSFVGGDRFDEWAARFVGHRARTRSLPEGIRRFATWAPLLIPFYIPRGRDWDYAWGGAERLANDTGPILPAVTGVLAGYGVAAIAAIIIGTMVTRVARRARTGDATRDIKHAPRIFTLGNGIHAFEADTSGRSYSRSFSALRKGQEIDLTRRPQDPLDIRGKFFYLRELGGGGKPDGELWSIGRQPAGVSGPDCALERPSPTSARWLNSHGDIRAEALVELAPDAAIEHWRIRLFNTSIHARVVILTSYQEWAMNGLDGYSRHTDYNAIHVGTVFVRKLGAIMARNRLLHNGHEGSLKKRMSREVAFHAVHAGASRLGPVQLLGYEDCRPHFIGTGTLKAPDILNGGQHRAIDDEGSLYSFDPAASLQLRVEIPPGGMIEIPFTDGYARDEYEAAALISRYAGQTPPLAGEMDAVFARNRQLTPPHTPYHARPLPFSFSADGRELQLACDTRRPMAHVLANPLGHGTIIGNDGAMFSFAGNAQQNGISTFCLDTIPAQSPAQMIYVQDLGTGQIDTPCYVPYRRKDATHHAIYGLGYAEFHKAASERDYRLEIFLPPDQPVELRILTIRNHAQQPARLRIAPYTEITLAELPRDSLDKIETAENSSLGALFFRNPRNDFHQGWAFAASSLTAPVTETVRSRFVGGFGGDLTAPFMLAHGHADATQADDGHRIALFLGEVEVPAGGEIKLVMMLGQTKDRAEAEKLIRHYREPRAAADALEKTKLWWRDKLSLLRVETSRPDFDSLVNDWLPYQVLASRLWGRAGPNQRGGAYGYRDQLQDVLPLIFSQPDLARRQIILHAGQQFREGDVLKWWHQAAIGGTGIGQRTSSGDPHLWLPYVTARYINASGNDALLDQQTPFLEGDPLPRGKHHLLVAPRPSRDSASIYEHCKRAVDLALSRKGSHGLPLIGSSDWNDSFDLAGIAGRGESVWLGFFLHDVLVAFAALAARRESNTTSAHYLNEAEKLRKALDAMWRKDRYVRLINDAGVEMTPLDTLSAAWPTLSGVADLARGRTAMEAALAKLELGDLILLLDKPFDENSDPNPGRIGDYPPGVRENGGQYSHGASWLVDALVRLGVMARTEGKPELAAQMQARAAEIWLKISPLDNLAPGRWEIYGLAPHQQPADVYFGEGYEGRGGWSWYSGAAARMISAAYALLGIDMQTGQMRLGKHAFDATGPIQLRRVFYRGKELTPEN
ncbi:MAG TPA: glycosyl transferase family 36 [Alphaproteobacteria bacterium]|nr:glycosyl transferase family 36 [Alphaproteobacteria bacterium]